MGSGVDSAGNWKKSTFVRLWKIGKYCILFAGERAQSCLLLPTGTQKTRERVWEVHKFM